MIPYGATLAESHLLWRDELPLCSRVRESGEDQALGQLGQVTGEGDRAIGRDAGLVLACLRDGADRGPSPLRGNSSFTPAGVDHPEECSGTDRTQVQ